MLFLNSLCQFLLYFLFLPLFFFFLILFCLLVVFLHLLYYLLMGLFNLFPFLVHFTDEFFYFYWLLWFLIPVSFFTKLHVPVVYLLGLVIHILCDRFREATYINGYTLWTWNTCDSFFHCLNFARKLILNFLYLLAIIVYLYMIFFIFNGSCNLHLSAHNKFSNLIFCIVFGFMEHMQ